MESDVYSPRNSMSSAFDTSCDSEASCKLHSDLTGSKSGWGVGQILTRRE